MLVDIDNFQWRSVTYRGTMICLAYLKLDRSVRNRYWLSFKSSLSALRVTQTESNPTEIDYLNKIKNSEILNI